MIWRPIHRGEKGDLRTRLALQLCGPAGRVHRGAERGSAPVVLPEQVLLHRGTEVLLHRGTEVLLHRETEVLLHRGGLPLALLLPLGASVLEPDLHLGLGEAQGRGDGMTVEHGQIVGALETVLQDSELVHGERGADPPASALGAGRWTGRPTPRGGAPGTVICCAGAVIRVGPRRLTRWFTIRSV